MTAFILAIVAGLIGALPQILTMIEARTTLRTKESDALIQRDLDVLRDGLDRLPKP